MDPTESQELLVAQVRHEVGEVLGGDLLNLTGEDVSLQNVGLDSLMAIELRNRLHRVLGVNLPMVAFLAGTTIAEDGGRAVRTPYDGCVLVMPSKALGKGQTAVRFGRFVDV